MSYSVKVEGLDKLTQKLLKSSDGPMIFDTVFANNARQSQSRLGRTTNRLTGQTARGWQVPQKIGLSHYRVENNTKTTDGKHSIPNILNFGRVAVYPKKSKRLYVPLSNKGRSKKAGAPIPENLIYGVDYVLKKSVGPFKGTRFIDNELVKVGADLGAGMMAKVNQIYGQ